MRESRSRRQVQDKADERRPTSINQHDYSSVSQESHLEQPPLSGRKATEKTGATEATRRRDERDTPPSLRSATKDDRAPSQTTTRYKDEMKRQHGIDGRRKFSDIDVRAATNHTTGARARQRALMHRRQPEGPDGSVSHFESHAPRSAADKASKMSGDPTSRSARSDSGVTRRSPREHTIPLRRKSSMASRVCDDIDSRIGHRSAQRSDSPPDHSIPPSRSTYMNSRPHDDFESRTYRRSGEHSPGSPPSHPSHPRRTSSRVSRVRGAMDSSAVRRIGSRRTDSPTCSTIPPRRSASKASSVGDNFESRSCRRSMDRSPRSTPDRPSPPRRTSSKTSRVRGYIESSNAWSRGSRRMDSPTDHRSPPRISASRALTVRDENESRTYPESGVHSPGCPNDHSSHPRETSKPSRVRSGVEQQRSGDPTKRNAPQECAHSGGKASTSRFKTNKTPPLDVKPLPKVDTAAKPSALFTKPKANGADVPQTKPADKVATGDAVARTKPAEVAAACEHQRPHGEASLEESEEAPITKPPETPSSEDYVPPSQTGKVVAVVVESLGPFSDDDDGEDQNGVEEDDSSFGWFRMWVLCSVAAIVLLIPFALTLMSYEATGRIHGDYDVSIPRESRPGESSPGAADPMRLEIYYDDMSGRPTKCELPNYTQVTVLKLEVLPTTSTTPSPDLTFRRVFCVYDILYLTGSLLTNLSYFPFLHCSDVIVYSFYYESTTADVLPKRPILVGSHPGMPFASPAFKHAGRKMNVYATFGGSRADTPALAQASANAARVASKLRGIVSSSQYTGVNFDWDHPNDFCDTQGNGLLLLLKEFDHHGDRVLITVPPDANVVKTYYPLFSDPLPQVEYVIVATHRLQYAGRVSCIGGHSETALAYWAMRKLLEPAFPNKVIYSTALGGDIYFSSWLELWTPGVHLSRSYDAAQSTPKLSYADVCDMEPVKRTDECALYLLESNTSGFKVAAFSGPEELWNRHIATHGAGMGRLAVVIYDIQLDDYEPYCSIQRWPLTRALSMPATENLRRYG